MAPTAPKKRPSIRAKSSGSGLISRPPTHREGAVISDSFINSKRDKRTIKHSAFVSRIEKAHKKPLKRRRPNKKLLTTLEGLADALPDLERDEKGASGNGGEGKIKLKGLKSRPGATKRREKVERMERERFGKNMAQLNSAVGVQKQEKTQVGVENMEVEGEKAAETNIPATDATASRWAALRGFISQTLEQKEEFRKS